MNPQDFGSAESFINNTPLAKTPIIQSFDDFMNGLIHKIGGVLDNWSESLRNMETSAPIVARGGNDLPTGQSVSPEAPAIARSQQIQPPEKTPMIQHEIIQSAKQATQAMSQPTFAMTEVHDHNVAPIGLNVSSGRGMGGIGGV